MSKSLTSLYIHEEVVHNFAAPKEVVPIIQLITKANSVLDVGCGIGTWLRIFEEHGVSDYLGIDGNHVDVSLLKIPVTKFLTKDLRRAWSLDRKFDIVICLEVAEHLPEESAEQFVKTIISHSDIIIFSAAIPGQGGQNHLNEQWPEYWQAKFENHGYFFHDVLRPLLWTNEKVDWWYRQNIFLITKNKPESLPFNALSIVHPKLFLVQKENEKQFYSSLLEGKQGLRMAFRILLNAAIFKMRNLFTFLTLFY